MKAPAKKGVDHELRVGSEAHYEDPRYYAHAYRDRALDVAYYARLARSHGGPILEYGCGSGRITLPMAREGAEVVGVDHSAPMLAALKEAVAAERASVRARISSHRGDMRAIAIKRKFPLIVATFNVVLHLYSRDDVERFLARVKAHLAPKGRFVFDASTPALHDLVRDPSRPYRARPFVHPTLGARVRYQERFDYDPIRQILFVAMEMESEKAQTMTPLSHRQFFPEELAALLHYNGLQVIAREGGFSGEPVDRHADVIVWTCTHRASSK